MVSMPPLARVSLTWNRVQVEAKNGIDTFARLAFVKTFDARDVDTCHHHAESRFQLETMTPKSADI